MYKLFFGAGLRRTVMALCFSLLAAGAGRRAGAGGVRAAAPDPTVRLETSLGEIVLRLDARKAPISTANFVQYVKSGFYDGTVFHRVIKNFMIQGGGLTPDLKQKETRTPIRNEADNGLKNKKGGFNLQVQHPQG
jgi:peptidyl-prolyl cis-trans isomerase B (cyclophilin B)